ncbi:MAG: hypothetical protein WDA24_12585 [Tissierellales bacterium]
MTSHSSISKNGKKPADTVLTPAMVEKAKAIAADKEKSLELLKSAGIVDKQGKLAKEYRT